VLFSLNIEYFDNYDNCNFFFLLVIIFLVLLPLATWAFFLPLLPSSYFSFTLPELSFFLILLKIEDCLGFEDRKCAPAKKKSREAGKMFFKSKITQYLIFKCIYYSEAERREM